MYRPHSVTLYNVTENPSTLVSDINGTLLVGVFLDVAQGSNVSRSGLENADSATLYVPFSVKAINVLTGEEQTYISPTEYEALEDKAKYWTLRASGSGSSVECYFAKGIVEEIGTFKVINGNYDNVYRVSSVDVKDYGTPSMQHWEVGGK